MLFNFPICKNWGPSERCNWADVSTIARRSIGVREKILATPSMGVWGKAHGRRHKRADLTTVLAKKAPSLYSSLTTVRSSYKDQLGTSNKSQKNRRRPPDVDDKTTITFCPISTKKLHLKRENRTRIENHIGGKKNKNKTISSHHNNFFFKVHLCFVSTKKRFNVNFFRCREKTLKQNLCCCCWIILPLWPMEKIILF